jgi:hypothetical protein
MQEAGLSDQLTADVFIGTLAPAARRTCLSVSPHEGPAPEEACVRPELDLLAATLSAECGRFRGFSVRAVNLKAL